MTVLQRRIPSDQTPVETPVLQPALLTMNTTGLLRDVTVFHETDRDY